MVYRAQLFRRSSFHDFSDRSRLKRQDRYKVTKTSGLPWTEELASRIESSEIVIGASNPDFCKTSLMAQYLGIKTYMARFLILPIGRLMADGACCIEMAVGPEATLIQGEEETKATEEPLDRSNSQFPLEGILSPDCAIQVDCAVSK